VKSGKLKYAWVTALPLAWLTTITTTAAYQKIFSDDVRVGFFAAANDLSAKLASGALPADKATVAPQLIFNQHLDAYLTMFFVVVLWVVIVDMLTVCVYCLKGKPVLPLSEVPHRATQLDNLWVRD
jgi:carbon starvation protein